MVKKVKVAYMDFQKFRNTVVECDEVKDPALRRGKRLSNCKTQSIQHAERPLTLQNGVKVQGNQKRDILFTDLVEIDTPRGKMRVLY